VSLWIANSASATIFTTSARSSYLYNRAIRPICPFLNIVTSKSIACAIVSSRLDYSNSIHTGISSRNIHCLQRVQNSPAQVSIHLTKNSTPSLASLHWLPLQQRIDYNPVYLSSLLQPYTPSRNLSSSLMSYTTQQLHTKFGERAFSHAGPAARKLLLVNIHAETSPINFCKLLKTHFF